MNTRSTVWVGLIFMSVICSSVFSATMYFTGSAGTTSWQTAGNWNGSTLPTKYDYTYIGNEAAGDLTVDINSGTAFAYRLYIGTSDMPEHEYTVNVNNGAYLSVANNNAHIYGGSKGILNVNSGSVSAWGTIIDGLEININDSSSSYSVNSDHWQIKGDSVVNVNAGYLKINNGSNFSCYNGANYNPYFTGTINLAGGMIRFRYDDRNAVNWHIDHGHIIAYDGNPDYEVQVTYDGDYTWVAAAEVPTGDNCFTGDGDGTSWDDPVNWSLGVIPVFNTSDTMRTYIGISGENENYNVIVDGEAGSGRTWLGIPETSGGSYTLTLEEGADVDLVRMYIGFRGTLNINDGVMSVPECVFQGSTGNITGGLLEISSPAWRITTGGVLNLTGGSITINNASQFSSYPTTDPQTGVVYNSQFTGTLNITEGVLSMKGNHVASLNWHINNGNLIAYDGDPAYHLQVIYDGTDTMVTAAYGTGPYNPSPQHEAIDVAVDTSLAWKVPPVVTSSTVYLGELFSADLNGDFSVDIDDLQIFAANYLDDSENAYDIADIDHDFSIDLTDLAVLAKQWNMETVFEASIFTNEGLGNPFVFTPAVQLQENAEYVWRVDTQTAEGTTTGDRWSFKTVGVKDIYWLTQAHPDIVEGLFADFDLTGTGLEQVNQAVSSGEWKKACNEMLNYYKNGSSGSWLRDIPDVDYTPEQIAAYVAAADAIVDNDAYTYQSMTGVIPRNADGGLDWTYDGPNNDIEWAFGINRFGHLTVLLIAYKTTDDPKYLHRLDEEIADWILHCPYPGAMSFPQWRGLEVAIRISNFITVFYDTIDDDEFRDSTRLLILSTLADHASYNRYHHQAGGNWLITEMRGLANVSAAFPEMPRSMVFLDYAFGKVEPQIFAQVYPDGAQNELTMSYHRVTMKEFEHFAMLGREVNNPVSQSFADRLELMWNYMTMAVRPNGYVPLNSDSDLTNIVSLVLKSADNYSRDDWRYVVTNGSEGTVPTGEPSAFFPYAGQLISRSSWDYDAHWSFFDFGPYGYGGHRHMDKLHFSADAYGRDILVDAGRFGYDGDIAETFRGYAVGTASHNVVRIAGQSQNVDASGNSSPQTDDCLIAPAYDFAKGTVTGGYTNTTGVAENTRLVRYERGKYWIIVDKFVTDQSRNIEAMWHYHPDCTVVTDGLETTSNDAGLGNIRIVPVGSVGWSLNIIEGQLTPSVQGWYSAKYGSYESNPTAVYTASITDDTVFAWLIIPGLGTPDPMTAEILSSDETSVTIKVTEAPGIENTVVMYY